MQIAMFYHSLISDWNHGNAHFLRGIATELQALGHAVQIYEPRNAWSVENLVEAHGTKPLLEFSEVYPGLFSNRYTLDSLDLSRVLDGVDLVLVHEWNDKELIRRIAEHRRVHGNYRLLFHDTHHRSISDRDSFTDYPLQDFDGILAFGSILAEQYRKHGWSSRVWVWHEAADTRIFRPQPQVAHTHDLVWIGNWGDGERSQRLYEFLFDPIRKLQLSAEIYGVRYPPSVLQELAQAQICYRGWLPNYRVPETFARFRVTMHIPRQPYVEALPGIPTIRVFEALACGIPLICSPWHDTESLFTRGKDYWVAHNGEEATTQLRTLLQDEAAATELAQNGRRVVMERHTCMHRARELLQICASMNLDTSVLAAKTSAHAA